MGQGPVNTPNVVQLPSSMLKWPGESSSRHGGVRCREEDRHDLVSGSFRGLPWLTIGVEQYIQRLLQWCQLEAARVKHSLRIPPATEENLLFV